MAVRIRNLEGKATQKVPSQSSYNQDVSVCSTAFPLTSLLAYNNGIEHQDLQVLSL